MPEITVLDKNTIDKIAAGEVVERPASVVKELLENAIDAKATAITVEIKDGGISFIRVTDNGCGIPKEQIRLAFLRHATSKIRSVEDLICVSSLGFRGEALASIASVSQVELITKTPDTLTGSRYQIEGGEEKSLEEVGAPGGTTFIARNLFYNVPARKKFLKTASTEGAHVAELVEKIALSRPDISIRFIQNNQNKLRTSGNGSIKDMIYTVFGREIASNLLTVDAAAGDMRITGSIGKPVIARSNRNMENYFINGRYIKSNIVAKAIEEAYRPFMMQHKYPFVMLHFQIDQETLDVNVHPAKMELRFADGEMVYRTIYQAVSQALSHKELIPQVDLEKKDPAAKAREAREKSRKLAPSPEPFEKKRLGVYEQTLKQLTSMSEDGFLKEGRRTDGPYGERKLNPLRSEREGRPAGAPDGSVAPARISSGAVGATAGMTAGPVGPVGTPASSSAGPVGASQPAPGQGPFDGREQREERQGALEPSLQAAGKGQLTGERILSGTDVQDLGDISRSGATAAGPDAHALGDISRSGATAAELDAQTLAGAAAGFDAQDLAGTSQERVDRQAAPDGSQIELFDDRFLGKKAREKHRLIGQLFSTYWLVEYDQQLFIIDQHAAHEKVLFEKTMKALKTKSCSTQMVSPPIILTLSMTEGVLMERYMSYFNEIGFEIEPFGGREYAVRGVPADLFSVGKKELLLELLDGLSEDAPAKEGDSIYEKVASMSCKAAVKGNHTMSPAEADALIDQLLDMENPYACPHGRPTIIAMSRYELEKKFKRVL